MFPALHGQQILSKALSRNWLLIYIKSIELLKKGFHKTYQLYEKR